MKPTPVVRSDTKSHRRRRLFLLSVDGGGREGRAVAAAATERTEGVLAREVTGGGRGGVEVRPLSPHSKASQPPADNFTKEGGGEEGECFIDFEVTAALVGEA